MGRFVCRQPNGLLCRFSTVVDTVIAANMTEEEYIERCAEEAREEARDVIKKHLSPFDLVKKRFLPYHNTIEEFEELLHSMGDTEGLGKERIEQLRKEFERQENE